MDTKFFVDQIYRSSHFSYVTLEHLKQLKPSHQTTKGMCVADVYFNISALNKGSINVLATSKAKKIPVTIEAKRSETDFTIKAFINTFLREHTNIALPEKFVDDEDKSFIFYHITNVDICDADTKETLIERIYSLYNMEPECWIKEFNNPYYENSFTFYKEDNEGNILVDYWEKCKTE